MFLKQFFLVVFLSFDLKKYGDELKKAVEKNEISADEAEKLYLEAKSRVVESNERKLDKSFVEVFERLKHHGRNAGVVAQSFYDKTKSIVSGSGEFNVLFLVFFIFLFVLIYISEYFLGGLSQSFNSVRFTYILLFLFFVYFFSNSSSDEKKVAFGYAMFNLFVPIFYSYVNNVVVRSSFFNVKISGGLVYVFFGVFSPAVLWWFYIYKREETFPKVVLKFANFAVPTVVFLLVLSGLSPAIAHINNIQSKDTGFDSGKFFDDFKTSLSSGVKNLFFMNSNKECSGFSCVSDWFNKNFVDPFKYDPAKVDEITNLDLGIYIRDLEVPKEVNVDSFSPDEFVVPPIKFYLESPIDSSVWNSICSDSLSFVNNVCDEKVFFNCSVEDTSTVVEPFEDSFYNVVASKKKFVVCNMYRPLKTGSKKVEVSVVYPFVTNTFKILRLVDSDYLRSNPEDSVLDVLDSDNSKLIVSNGGPVIVSSSEDKYILVSSNTKFPVVFSFKPVQDFKLKNISSVFLTLPLGVNFDSSNSNVCSFEKVEGYNVGSRVMYRMSDSSLDFLNNAISNNRDNIGFGCTFVVDKDKLNFDGNSFVEKSLNLVTEYSVVETKKDNIFFSGGDVANFYPSNVNPSSVFNLYGCVDNVFSDIDFSNFRLSDPLKGKGYFTSCFEYRKDVSPHYHFAVDIGTNQLSDNTPKVFSAVDGVVSKVGFDPEGYGNYVVVDKKVSFSDGSSKNVFYILRIIYGHLSFVDNAVRQGDSIRRGAFIGKVGSTGNSNGNHLHFEVKLVKVENGKEVFSQNVNPLYLVDSSFYNSRNSNVYKYVNAKICKPDFSVVESNSKPICKFEGFDDSYSIVKKVDFDKEKFKSKLESLFLSRGNSKSVADSFFNVIVKDNNCKKLNPGFIVGVASAETSLKSSSLVCENNYFNIRYSDRSYQDGSCNNDFSKYSSVENSVRDFCSLIVNSYIPKGQVSVRSLVEGSHVYTTTDKDVWVGNVNSVMDFFSDIFIT